MPFTPDPNGIKIRGLFEGETLRNPLKKHLKASFGPAVRLRVSPQIAWEVGNRSGAIQINTWNALQPGKILANPPYLNAIQA